MTSPEPEDWRAQVGSGFSGAIAEGPGTTAVGERGLIVQGAVNSPIITGDHVSINLPPNAVAQMFELIQQQTARVIRPAVAELFTVIRQPEEVPAAFFRALRPSTHLIPYAEGDVPYLPGGRVGERDTRSWLGQQLGRLLVVTGRRGIGKTRETAELARSLCAEGWTVCLARYSQRRKMGGADELLPDGKLLFVVDDLYRHAVQLSPESLSYWNRLYAFLQPYLETPGLKVRVLVTTVAEAGGGHLPAPDHPLTGILAACELPDFELAGLSDLLGRVAENAGRKLAPEAIAALVRQGNRTPKTIVANVERALSRNAAITPESWMDTWEGRWTEEFREASLEHPEVPAVYRALYLLGQAGVAERPEYVTALTARWEAADASRAADELVKAGILTLTDEKLTAFGEEQLSESLESLDEPLPDLDAHWDDLILTVVGRSEARPEWATDLVALAEVLVDAKSWDPAEAVATKALERDAELADAYRWRCLARFHLTKLPEAEQDATSLLRLRPDEAKSALMRGGIRLLSGNYAGAEADATVALEAGRKDAFLLRGLARMQQGNSAGANIDFSAILQDGEDNVFASRMRGYLRFLENDLTGAVADYTEVLERLPKDQISLLMRGLAYLRLEDHATMVADADALIEIAPSAFNHALRAIALSALGELDEAVDGFTAAIAALERDPDPVSSLLPELARAIRESRAGEEELSPELLRSFAESFSQLEGESDADLAGTAFFGDWMKRLVGQLQAQQNLGDVALWEQPGALYHLARAEVYILQERWADAQSDLEAALALGSGSARVHYLLGVVKMNRGDLLGTEESYAKVIELEPESPVGYALRGMVRVDIPKSVEALSDLRTAQEMGTETAIVMGLQGLCLFRLGQFEEAEKALHGALGLDGSHRLAPYLLGAIDFKRQEFGSAISNYTRALESGFENPLLFLERGLALLETGDPERARADLERAVDAGLKEEPLLPLRAALRIEEGTGSSRDYLVRAQNRLFQNRPAEAEADYTLAIDGGLEEAEALAQRGRARHLKGELGAALEDLNKAIAVGPVEPYFHPWRAMLRKDLKDWTGLIADLGVVIDQGEVGAGEHYERGLAYMEVEDYDAAKADLDRAEAMGYRSPELPFHRARARFNTEDYEGAIADCGTVIDATAEIAMMFQIRALALLYSGEIGEAGVDCEKAAELEPDGDLTHRCRGFHRLANGNPETAVKSFEAELAARPDPLARTRLGLAHLCSGEVEHSVAAYAEALPELTATGRKDALKDLDHWLERIGEGVPPVAADRERIRALLS